MKKMIAVSLAVAVAALLCQVAFGQEERPRRRPRGEGAITAEQREQLRPLMQRLREINQNEALREVTVEARQDEKVGKAQEVVRKAQEALRNAQQKANDVLNKTVLAIAKKKEMKELINLLKERNEILEKLPPQFRGRFPGRRPGATTPRRGPRPAASGRQP
jgi:hypothetical protein